MSKRLSTRLTGSDWFCGAGGSSEGAVFANVEVVAAANHWQLAIDTHNTNHPDTDHYLTNLSQADPRYFPSTNILWCSPECTNHGIAKGKKRKNLGQRHLFDPAKVDPAEERSRATMWCVPRFAEYHDYDIVIVENVVDVRHWVMWDAWLLAMNLLGYEYKTCYFNSMFFNPINGLSDYAPQSRDRIYIVFWKKGNQAPALDFRPKAWCAQCQADIEAVQSWKNPSKRWGRYGQHRQYLYRCPKCAQVAEPYYFAAFNCIDWSLESPRIGDRARPLKPKTIKRIEIGLEKYGRQPLLMQTAFTHAKNNRSYPLTSPSPTQTSRQEIAFIVSNRGTLHNHTALAITDPLPTQTTSNPSFIVSMVGNPAYNVKAITDPLPTQCTERSPYIVELFGQSKARDIKEPLGCVVAGGINYGLVTTTKHPPRESVHQPITEALGTASTEPRFALIMPQPFITSYYNGSNVVHGVDEALQTVTSTDRHAVVIPEKPKVEDCGFRMLQPHEIQAAMGFREDYVLLGTKRQKIRLSGNAVTPPVAEWLYRQCAKTFQ